MGNNSIDLKLVLTEPNGVEIMDSNPKTKMVEPLTLGRAIYFALGQTRSPVPLTREEITERNQLLRKVNAGKGNFTNKEKELIVNCAILVYSPVCAGVIMELLDPNAFGDEDKEEPEMEKEE